MEPRSSTARSPAPECQCHPTSSGPASRPETRLGPDRTGPDRLGCRSHGHAKRPPAQTCSPQSAAWLGCRTGPTARCPWPARLRWQTVDYRKHLDRRTQHVEPGACFAGRSGRFDGPSRQPRPAHTGCRTGRCLEQTHPEQRLARSARTDP